LPGLERRAAAAGDRPALPAEGPADATPATVLVRPAEVLLKPGQSVRFQAALYDKQGRFIKSAEAQWSYSGKGGTLSSDGQFTAGPKARSEKS